MRLPFFRKWLQRAGTQKSITHHTKKDETRLWLFSTKQESNTSVREAHSICSAKCPQATTATTWHSAIILKSILFFALPVQDSAAKDGSEWHTVSATRQ